MTAEHDPLNRVVDITTFGYYVIGYISDSFRQDDDDEEDLDMSLEEFREIMHAGRNNPTEAEVQEEYAAYLDYSETLPDERNIYRRTTWENIPESIQDMLAVQYAAASLPEEKKVHVRLTRERVSFYLHSPSIKTRADATLIDSYGEYAFNPMGLVLQFADNPYPSQKGNWVTTKAPLTNLNPEHHKRVFSLTSTPVTLPQLHDTVGLLERLKHAPY